MAKKAILVILLFFTWGFIFNSVNAEETNNWNSESLYEKDDKLEQDKSHPHGTKYKPEMYR